jgi:UDP-glucose 4-epimerase
VSWVTERVLVSGSAGFIGGYLTEELLARGYEVVGIDNFSKYGPRRSPHEGDPGYTFVPGDATDTELVTSLLADCDQFIAAAAMAGGISYFHAYPYDILAANERITASSFDAAIRAHRRGRLRKVTYVSSSMVYERAAAWPSHEGQQLEVPPPRSTYGLQKLAGEYLARAAWEQYGLPFTIVRPFNCVGVGECRALRAEEVSSGDVKLAMSHVIPDLVVKVLKGQDPLRILGSGDQLRHFTYGGDIALGLLAAMECPEAAGEDFNLATTTGTTVLELARLIWTTIRGPDVPLRLEHDEPYRDDVQRRVPATGKARRILGFEARTTLPEMVDEVIGWVTQALAAGLL